jgi:hypothetical protein
MLAILPVILRVAKNIYGKICKVFKFQLWVIQKESALAVGTISHWCSAGSFCMCWLICVYGLDEAHQKLVLCVNGGSGLTVKAC